MRQILTLLALLARAESAHHTVFFYLWVFQNRLNSRSIKLTGLKNFLIMFPNEKRLKNSIIKILLTMYEGTIQKLRR